MAANGICSAAFCESTALRTYPFRLLPLVAATFPKGTAELPQSSLRDASSLGEGAFGMAVQFPA